MNKVEEQIIAMLKAEQKPVMITEIAQKLHLERHTTAKYLETLAGKGICEFSPKGKSKQWQLTSSPLLKLIEEESPIIDELKVVLSNLGEVSIHDKDHNIKFSTKETSQKCYEEFAGATCECQDCPVHTGSEATHNHNNKATTCRPIKDHTNNVVGIIGVTKDNTRAAKGAHRAGNETARSN